MNRQSGRIGLYLVLIVMLVAGYFYLNNQVTSQSSYSMESMKQAAKDGKVTSAKIYQNREVPTGSVVADIEGEGQKRVYVTDVKDAEDTLESYDIHPEIADVPQESVFMTTLSSDASYRCTCNFSFSYDEPSDVRRRRKCQDDEFRQEPCKNDASG